MYLNFLFRHPLKKQFIILFKRQILNHFGTISLSFLFLIWSAGKSFYSLDLGISAIYKTNSSKSKFSYLYLRLKAVIGTLIMALSIALILVLMVFGNKFETYFEEKLPAMNNTIKFILNVKNVIAIISLFFIFLLIYRFIPNKDGIILKNQIPGAIFASISWIIVSYFFSIYIDIYSNFSVIYGSLTAIVLILIWVYTIIYIILLGAEINIMIDEKFYSK